VSVRIYVEGGGPSKKQNAAIKCRQAFRLFCDQFDTQRKPHIVASGGRKAAYDDFTNALANPQYEDDEIFLLVDSESNVASGVTTRQHLHARDGWDFAGAISEYQLHMMVQCMEAWFMADKEAIANYYGAGFLRASLPQNPNIEVINKADIFEGLKRAARNTTKEGYDKGRDGFAILSRINAALVCEVSPRARLFRDCLLRALAQGRTA
jgi:hypothetical protein